jgi:osmotically-inducible protein OsmY
MTALLSKTDHDIRTAVRDELEWIPELRGAPKIAVGVANGVVTLTGLLYSHAQRVAANGAAHRVRGVAAVVDHLDIARTTEDLPEEELSSMVRKALDGAPEVPSGIMSNVNDGVVVLTGEVQWDHQRRSAQRVAAWVKGVRAVDNRVTLSHRASAADTHERIRNALVRNAIIDANAIDVETEGTTVILRGTVRTWLEKSQASRTAWASPHVAEVDNRIIVEAD